MFDRHVMMLLCADVAQARDFYVKHLDLEINADLGWFVGLQQRGKSRDVFELSLCEAGHKSLPAQMSQPTSGLVFAIDVGDVSRFLTNLQVANVAILSEVVDEPWGQRHFFAAAPDGVILDIFEPIPPDMDWLKQNGFVPVRLSCT